MPAMIIKLEEPAWPELQEKMRTHGPASVVHIANDDPIQVCGLSGGMTSGRPSVAIRLDLPNGTTVIAETSLRLFLMAADALKAKFGTGGN